MKTRDGYEVCIKADEVNCNGTSCSAYGRLYSLTGSESKHWSTSDESSVDSEAYDCSNKYEENKFTCQAAKAHGKY